MSSDPAYTAEPDRFQINDYKVKEYLTQLGFEERPYLSGQSAPDGCECLPSDVAGGACTPAKTECIVLYFNLQDPNAATHAALYDHSFCDWGGKMRPTEPIKRFRSPIDYIGIVDHPDADVANYNILFYCRPLLDDELGPMVTDLEFNTGAYLPNLDGSKPKPGK